MAITEKELRFIKHYSIHGSGAAAAREAGYSEKGARQAAYKILRRADVKAMLDDLKTNKSGFAARAIEEHDRMQDHVATIKDLQRLAHISMGKERVKRLFPTTNQKTGEEELVEREVSAIDLRGAFNALELVSAELDRFETPGGQRDFRHESKVQVARMRLRNLLEGR